jgi:micrococcal nuclease
MRKALMCRLLILILFLLLPSIAFSETITGKVIKVADGDTITILTPGNKQIKIRLSAVDTLEGGQAYGKKAKQFTSKMVYKKSVQVDKETIDRYGRTVGFVHVNGTNLNKQIVANGYGWVYRKYCKGAFCDD